MFVPSLIAVLALTSSTESAHGFDAGQWEVRTTYEGEGRLVTHQAHPGSGLVKRLDRALPATNNGLESRFIVDAWSRPPVEKLDASGTAIHTLRWIGVGPAPREVFVKISTAGKASFPNANFRFGEARTDRIETFGAGRKARSVEVRRVPVRNGRAVLRVIASVTGSFTFAEPTASPKPFPKISSVATLTRATVPVAPPGVVPPKARIYRTRETVGWKSHVTLLTGALDHRRPAPRTALRYRLPGMTVAVPLVDDRIDVFLMRWRGTGEDIRGDVTTVAEATAKGAWPRASELSTRWDHSASWDPHMATFEPISSLLSSRSALTYNRDGVVEAFLGKKRNRVTLTARGAGESHRNELEWLQVIRTPITLESIREEYRVVLEPLGVEMPMSQIPPNGIPRWRGYFRSSMRVEDAFALRKKTAPAPTDPEEIARLKDILCLAVDVDWTKTLEDSDRSSVMRYKNDPGPYWVYKQTVFTYDVLTLGAYSEKGYLGAFECRILRAIRVTPALISKKFAERYAEDLPDGW